MTESLPARVPVLIAGAGPVGLAVALELGLHGVPCLLVEPRSEVSWLRPRAKTTSARTMEYLRRWGVASAVRQRAPLPVDWSDLVVFCTTLLGREVTRFDRCFGLELTGDDLVAEAGQQIPQPLVEVIMREAVAASPTARLVTGWSVTGVDQDEDGVRVEVRDQAGAPATVRADYVVGCDGARGVVRRAVGVGLSGRDDNRPNFNIVFRAPDLAERVPHPAAVHYWVLNPKQPGIVGRMDLGDQWWCIAVGVTAEAGDADPVGLVRNLIGHPALPVRVLATDPWRSRMLLADRYAVGRVLLAGDAAHQNPPWGGHGFNTGIGDAVNLGWKLAAVLRGWAPRSLLDSYEAERRPIAARTIAAAERNMATLTPELADPRLLGSDAEFAAALPGVVAAVRASKSAEFHSLDLVLGAGYPDSPIVARAAPGPESPPGTYLPTAAPGFRLPHRWLRPGRSLYDELGPGFSLVGATDSAGGRALREAAQRLGVPLTAVPLEPDQTPPGFDAPLVLVRPDQHVAWRGRASAEPDRLLRQVTGDDPTQR
jgi:2-polyprenyl-6-methoxyphenol hydroxylase-like FAD-dependent oxidoreductase